MLRCNKLWNAASVFFLSGLSGHQWVDFIFPLHHQHSKRLDGATWTLAAEGLDAGQLHSERVTRTNLANCAPTSTLSVSVHTLPHELYFENEVRKKYRLVPQELQKIAWRNMAWWRVFVFDASMAAWIDTSWSRVESCFFPIVMLLVSMFPSHKQIGILSEGIAGDWDRVCAPATPTRAQWWPVSPGFVGLWCLRCRLSDLPVETWDYRIMR